MTPENLPGICVEQTTYRDDYRTPEISKDREKNCEPHNITKPKEKISKSVKLFAESHDTFQKLDYESRLPFDALWQTKEIVGASDRNNDKIGKNRPEVYNENVSLSPKIGSVSPAVSLNDVKDPETRKLVVNFTYKTTTGSAADEVWRDFNKTDKTSLNSKTIENLAETVSFKLKPSPEIPEKFAKAAKKWDLLQPRTLIDDPTSNLAKSFHFSRTNDDTTRRADRCAFDRSIYFENRLRLPYQKLSISYGGHRTPVALGVPLKERKSPRL